MYGSIWHQPIRPFFHTDDLTLALEAEHAGIFSVVVDWQRVFKPTRSFLLTKEQPGKVALLVNNLRIPVTVILNQLGPKTADEVEHALDMGARILMLPRATHPAEVESFVSLVRGRAQTFIKIETDGLVQRSSDLRGIGWDFAHIDLENLSFDQRRDWVWQPLEDGTIETVCNILAGRNLGFGVAQPIGERTPVEALGMLREMARLQCGNVTLGPAFERASAERNFTLELKVLYAAFEAALWRESQAVQLDHQKLQTELLNLVPDRNRKAAPYHLPTTFGDTGQLNTRSLL